MPAKRQPENYQQKKIKQRMLQYNHYPLQLHLDRIQCQINQLNSFNQHIQVFVLCYLQQTNSSTEKSLAGREDIRDNPYLTQKNRLDFYEKRTNKGALSSFKNEPFTTALL